MGHAIFNSTVIIKCYKSKPSWSSSFFIHHQCCIKNSSKLFEIFLEFFFNHILTNPSDEYLRRTILLVPRNCTFRINL